MGTKWSFLDNYEKHNNGRIWMIWDESKIKVKRLAWSNQYIHCELEYIKDGINTLEQRKKLWRDIKSLQSNSTWFLMGDFNNMCNTQDKVGGSYLLKGNTWT